MTTRGEQKLGASDGNVGGVRGVTGILSASSFPLVTLMVLARRLLLVVLLGLSVVVARAATINVGRGQLYTTIQAGIDAAASGDTVLVAPGTYFENIDFKGKAITVTSSGGAAATVIDGGGVTGTVTFRNAEQRTSVISNFTIRNGGAPANTSGLGGVFVEGATPTILNNVITGNACAGVWVATGGALVQGNDISGSTLPVNGYTCPNGPTGVVLINNLVFNGSEHSDLLGNTIENNPSTGVVLNMSEGSVIQGNTIRNNGGSGLLTIDTEQVSIVQNLFYGNTVTNAGATVPSGLMLVPVSTITGPFLGVVASNTIADGLMLMSDPAQYLVINNVITSPSATTAAVQCAYSGPLILTPPSFDHNDVYNAAGPAYGTGCPDQTGTYGNLSVDPGFVNAGAGNYELTAQSPVLDKGNNSAPLLPATDLLGAARVQSAPVPGIEFPQVDMGAYEFAGGADPGHTVMTLTPNEYFASSNPPPAPRPLTLTAQLNSAAGQPTGFVAFYEDSVLLGVVDAGGTGTAVLTPKNVASGAHAFTAVYPAPGSGFVSSPFYETPAVSAKFFLLVPESQTPLSLSATPNPSAYGAAVTFAAKTNATTVVTLTDSSTGLLLATLTSDAAGNAAYTTPALQPGTHGIVAAVAASATESGASSTVNQVVQPVPTGSLLVVTNPAAGTVYAGSVVTVTATVTAAASTGVAPGGTVSFYNNGALTGMAGLTNGTAQAMFKLAAGPASLTCVYSGDMNYAMSACGAVNISVVQPSQTTTFPAPGGPAYAATAVALQAVSSAGLPVRYTVVSGPASVAGSTLTYSGAGTVVVEADQAGDGTYPAAAPVQQSVNVTILTEPLTGASAPVTTLVTILNAGTLAAVNASTQGAQGLDFGLTTIAGGVGATQNACQVGTVYAAGQTCTVQFVFTPLHPGLRYGGVTLTAADGTLLANSYLLGLGTGPQVLYNPPNQTNVGTGFGGLSGVAVDGNGNVYTSDIFNGAIYQVSATTGATRLLTPAPIASDVAVDGSGNVIYTTRNAVGEILAVNGVIPANPQVRVLATGFLSIDGVKVDATGNVFVAEGGQNVNGVQGGGGIQEVLAVNGIVPVNPVIRKLVTFGIPTGVAIDVAGNVYFSDEQTNGVYELLAVGGSIPAVPVMQKLAVNFLLPANVSFDVSGNLYVPDYGFHDVQELLAVNLVLPANPVVVALGTGLGEPAGVFIDSGGSLYVADETLPYAVKLAYGSAPTLNFGATEVGQTSADSPQVVTITNGGNAPLTIAPPASGTNPSISANFAIGAGTTCPQLTPGSAAATLAVNASCTTAVSFTPTAVGNLSGTLVRTDDNLGVAGATQTILLNGLGVGIPPAIVFAVGNHTFGDAPFTVGATSNSPGAFTYSVLSGPATLAGTTVTLTGAGVVVLQASEAASGVYAAGTATAAFNVAKKAQTIVFVQPASPVAFTVGPIALVASASSGLPVGFSVLSGPGRVSGNVLTVTGGGTIVLAADQAGDANYAAAAEVSRTVMVLYGTATVTLTGAPNPVFVRNPVTLAAGVAAATGVPGGSVTFMEGGAVLGSGAIVNGAAALTTAGLGVGLHTITAVYGGDAHYAMATSASIVISVQDFSLTITNPAVVIQHGGVAVYHVVVTSVGGVGLAGTISLVVAGEPDHSTYTFAPAQVAAGSGTTGVTLTIQTPDYPTGPYPGHPEAMLGGRGTVALAGLLGLLLVPRRRRWVKGLLVLVVGVMALTAVSGCGSGWKTQGFDVTVTATSGALVRTAGATLSSQP